MASWNAEVDAFAALAMMRPSGDVRYRDPARTAVSGRWLGGFMQPFASFRTVCMDVELHARGAAGPGAFVGAGIDPLARFTLAGDAGPDRVAFGKTYIGRHTVVYAGIVDERAMRGTWTLGGARGLFVLYRASALTAAVVASVACRALRNRSALDAVFAGFAAPFRRRARETHTRLIEGFDTFDASPPP